MLSYLVFMLDSELNLRSLSNSCFLSQIPLANDWLYILSNSIFLSFVWKFCKSSSFFCFLISFSYTLPDSKRCFIFEQDPEIRLRSTSDCLSIELLFPNSFTFVRDSENVLDSLDFFMTWSIFIRLEKDPFLDLFLTGEDSLSESDKESSSWYNSFSFSEYSPTSTCCS